MISLLRLEELNATSPAPVETAEDIPILCEFLQRTQATMKRLKLILPTTEDDRRLEGCVRILAGLPPNLERLAIWDWHLYHIRNSEIEDDRARRRARSPHILEHFFATFTTPLSCRLENLAALTLKSREVDLDLLVPFLTDRCPNLQELNYKNAILEHAPTLENLEISGCEAFDSQAIQTLLCNAPRLKRFDTIATSPLTGADSCVLLTKDILSASSSSSQGQGWVCLELESFKCIIAGVPRPEIQAKRNGRPLTDSEYHNHDYYSLQQSRSIQRRVLAQLGRLTNLRELTLGQDLLDSGFSFDLDHHRDGEYHYKNKVLELGYQYECLNLTLQDGLNQLQGLKKLRRLFIEQMSHGQKESEKAWMQEHWPEFDKPTWDTFWTSRGHRVYSEHNGPRSDQFLWDWW
ncbi:hypothetical protein BGZ83_006598 [Gryganskiella cystojenkinii]|nr:hypothetical protein BGZ83_006598 [Gryganskiella cystojenkinii]